MRCVAKGFLLASTSLVACNGILGIDELPGEGPVVVHYAEVACGECVAEVCEAEERACLEDRDCSKFAACTASVGLDDPGARFACDTNYEEGRKSAAGQALDTCRRKSCRNECYGIGGHLQYFGDSCAACMTDEGKCKTEIVACVEDAPCDRGLACVGNAPDPERTLHCFYDVGEDSPAFEAAEDCMEKCREECGFGGLLDCSGNYVWGVPGEIESVDLHFSIDELFKGPLDGVRVDVCESPSAECDSAGFDVSAAGAVELDLSVVSKAGGFIGYLQLTPAVPLTEMPIYTVFFGRPIYRKETRMGWTMATWATAQALVSKQPVPEYGHLGVTMWDCLFQPAGGITLEVDAASVDPAHTAAFPSFTTQPNGVALILNLRPGCVTVRGRVDGKLVAEQNVVIEKGVVSGLFLFPLTASQAFPTGCVK